MSHLPCGWDFQSLQLLDRTCTLTAAIFLHCSFQQPEAPSESTKLGSSFKFISKFLILIARSIFHFRKMYLKRTTVGFQIWDQKFLYVDFFGKILC